MRDISTEDAPETEESADGSVAPVLVTLLGPGAMGTEREVIWVPSWTSFVLQILKADICQYKGFQGLGKQIADGPLDAGRQDFPKGQRGKDNRCFVNKVC